uniref:Uncharacterized protein n=1 Tax=Arundo donax TaxID=35708 RepID=A0A0A8YC94_ARUDO
MSASLISKFLLSLSIQAPAISLCQY